MHVRMLRPEVRDVSLLGRANGAVGSPEVACFNEIPGIAFRRQGIRSAGPEGTGTRQRERGDLRELSVHWLSATPAIWLELTRRRWGGTAFVEYYAVVTVVCAQEKHRSRGRLTRLDPVILGGAIRDGG